MSEPSDAQDGRKKRWVIWLVSLIAVPPLLAAMTSVVNRKSIEQDLTSRTESALAEAGHQNATVEYRGRDATVTTADAAAADEIRDAVRGVEGNRVVKVKAGDAPDDNGTKAPGAYSVAADGDTVTVTATVPDEAAKKALLDAARAGGRNVVDKVTVEPGTTAPDAATIGSLVGALGTGAGTRGISVDGDAVTLTGGVASDAAKAEAAEAAAEAVPGATVDNQLTVEPTTPPSPAAPDPAAGQAAQAEINRVLAGSTVNFNPDSSSLTPAGLGAVQRVAAVLKKYPTVRTEIRGHVARTGNAGADMRLSQARANAVVAALRRSGVAANRLVARGFGSTKPLTTNPAQTSRNRRVEFAILGGTK